MKIVKQGKKTGVLFRWDRQGRPLGSDTGGYTQVILQFKHIQYLI